MTLLTRDPVLPLLAREAHGGSECGFGTYWQVVDQTGRMPLALAMSGDENRLMDEQWCKGAADGWNAASGMVAAPAAETVQQDSGSADQPGGEAETPCDEPPSPSAETR